MLGLDIDAFAGSETECIKDLLMDVIGYIGYHGHFCFIVLQT